MIDHAAGGSLLWVRTGGVLAFDVDPSWVKPGRYTAFHTPRRIEVDTARGDLRQHITAVGMVEVTINGRQHMWAS
jgi:hypothetical protein